MAHWTDIYPHKVYASVLLLDGKIEGWKVGNPPKTEPLDFKAYWKRDRLADYRAEFIGFTVNNDKEHDDAFRKLSPEWFKQWELADDLHGSPPYTVPVNYWDIARLLLPYSNCLKRHYACVIVKDGHIIAGGWNESHTACTVCSREGIESNAGDYAECKSVHAEQMALITARENSLAGAELYLVCDRDADHFPCPICARMLAWAGVKVKRESDG